MWDQTSKAMSVYYGALDWAEGMTNIPNSRHNMQLISPCELFDLSFVPVYVHWLTVLL